jgi:hypothetical protein
MKYVNRIIEKKIKENLAVMGAVVIEGIKACGKTETGRIFAESEIRLDFEDFWAFVRIYGAERFENLFRCNRCNSFAL